MTRKKMKVGASMGALSLRMRVPPNHSTMAIMMVPRHSLTGWARALPGKGLPYPGKRPTAFIVICQNTEWEENIARFQKDVGIVAQTMLLAAAEMGLGGIMIGNFSPEKVSLALELPENIVPVLIVAVGKPDETVVLTEAENGQSLNYYRDENDVHYVPKRKLENIIL